MSPVRRRVYVGSNGNTTRIVRFDGKGTTVISDILISADGRRTSVPVRGNRLNPGERPTTQTRVGYGVGEAFFEITESLGIKTPIDCLCRHVRNRMNSLGPDGCRRERPQLLVSLRENAKRIRLSQKLRAIPLSIWTGLVWKVNPLDPLPGMFDEAVRMAEKKAAEKESDS